jgi:hypothetical protein
MDVRQSCSGSQQFFEKKGDAPFGAEKTFTPLKLGFSSAPGPD